MRQSRGLFLLIVKRQSQGNLATLPEDVDLFNLRNLSEKLNVQGHEFFTPHGFVSCFQGEDGDVTLRVEPWLEGYNKNDEYHNCGYINAEAIHRIGSIQCSCTNGMSVARHIDDKFPRPISAKYPHRRQGR